MMPNQDLALLITRAIEKRKGLFDSSTNVFRIFNGFLEGIPNLVLEIYGTTLLILDHNKSSLFEPDFFEQVRRICWDSFPYLSTAILKKRDQKSDKDKNGIFLYGRESIQYVQENGVKYAVHLQMNQDSGYYIDTRNLRIWLKENLTGKDIVNTFAYTGSLGVAALAGGANKVVQSDLNPKFLDIARLSAQLNGISPSRHEMITGDFFRVISRLKNENKLFDCVIIDPPFFSSTQAGKLEIVNDSIRLVNKVRPIIRHKGIIVLVNNSLFLSGVDFHHQVETLCESGYVAIRETIPIAQDITGFPETVVSSLPADPFPFNHSTKIVVLNINRKDERIK
jgi:23S rRNA (cytosine1962-C5)-methyltransferase